MFAAGNFPIPVEGSLKIISFELPLSFVSSDENMTGVPKHSSFNSYARLAAAAAEERDAWLTRNDEQRSPLSCTPRLPPKAQ